MIKIIAFEINFENKLSQNISNTEQSLSTDLQNSVKSINNALISSNQSQTNAQVSNTAKFNSIENKISKMQEDFEIKL